MFFKWVKRGKRLYDLYNRLDDLFDNTQEQRRDIVQVAEQLKQDPSQVTRETLERELKQSAEVLTGLHEEYRNAKELILKKVL